MLKKLFFPSSVAIIGASNNHMKSGGMFLKSLIDNRFLGNIYPVNPRFPEVMGLKSYASLQDIPSEIDLVIVTIPADTIIDKMTECASKGVKFVIVHTAGFAEIGPEGRELEKRIVSIARDGGVRIVGPNCMGVYCPDGRINTIVPSVSTAEMSPETALFMPELKTVNRPPESGSVSFFGQSGWATETFILEGLERGLRFNNVVSIGNQCDLEITDYLEYFGQDEKTSIIGAYVEGIKDGRRFISLAKEISKRKPIIIWKSGRSAAGARAAESHTGSLAGSSAIFDAALKQAGVIIADSIYELIDYVVAFSSPISISGKRVGMLMEAGGGAVASSDACESNGLEVPTFSIKIQDEIKGFMKELGAPLPSVKNPIDLVWPPFDKIQKIIIRCLEIISEESDVILWLTFFPLSDEGFASVISDIRDRVMKPIFVVPTYASAQREYLGIYTQRGLPSFPRVERAIKAISAFFRYTSSISKE